MPTAITSAVPSPRPQAPGPELKPPYSICLPRTPTPTSRHHCRFCPPARPRRRTSLHRLFTKFFKAKIRPADVAFLWPPLDLSGDTVTLILGPNLIVASWTSWMAVSPRDLHPRALGREGSWPGWGIDDPGALPRPKQAQAFAIIALIIKGRRRPKLPGHSPGSSISAALRILGSEGFGEITFPVKWVILLPTGNLAA